MSWSSLAEARFRRIYLPDVVGKGYGAFWRFRGRYRVCKGSRASKKSKTTALWYVYNMMKHPGANLLVVRKTGRTLKDSCFTELKWAARRLGCADLWKFTESPLQAEYRPTGQRIFFRGLDDPLKVTSITVDVGILCWLWIEEAYEVLKESDFDTLDESIRGECPPGLFKQITLTFNPWSDRHWMKHRFFDDLAGYDDDGKPIYRERENPVSDDGEILAMTTNYTLNEWLDSSDLRLFERMKRTNPKRYRVAGLGDWGVVDGLVYENWVERRFALEDLPKDAKPVFGLDFGYTNDPTAGFCGFFSASERRIYAWDELYAKGLSNRAIWDEVQRMGYAKESWTGDSAEPKSIDELKGYGMRIKGAKKGKGSVNNGIQWVQDMEIVVHPRCANLMTELSTYQWRKDRFGKTTNEPEDENNHLMDAMRYGCEQYIAGNCWLI